MNSFVQAGMTTGIGSLPHHNIDAALEFSFRFKLPFLPQIPIRNPLEFMLNQALDRLPGLLQENDGSVSLDYDLWTRGSAEFEKTLRDAFNNSSSSDAFELFELTSSSSSCWQPFLWELQERGFKIAKLQLAGPITSTWMLGAVDKTKSKKNQFEDDQRLWRQVFQLILAKSFAMCRSLQAVGIQPVFFLDEPAWMGLNFEKPSHRVMVQELNLMIQALRKEKIIVGLHCCSDVKWDVLLGLDLDLLSFDAALSFCSVVEKYRDALEKFISRGSRLVLGVISTAESSLDLNPIFDLDSYFTKDPSLKLLLSQSLYSPACGLALLSIQKAESIAQKLFQFQN